MTRHAANNLSSKQRPSWPLAAVFFAIPLGLGLIASDMLGDRWGTKSAPPGSKSPSPEGPFTSPLGSLALPAAGCGMPECHYESYQEWSVSKHRFSAVNLRYRESVDLLSREQGWAATKLCMECHNPLLRFADLDESAGGAEEDRLRNEGVTCVACHAVDLHGANSGAGVRGPMSHPKTYLSEVREDRPGRDALVEDFTYLYVRPHRSSYVKKGRRSSELCAVCHAARPEGDPSHLRLHVGDVYASWKNSSAAREGFGCRECHMQMFDLNWEHPPWSHQFFGLDTNFSADLPEPWRGDGEIARAEKNVQEWLDGSLVVAPRLLRYLQWMGDPQPAAYEKHIRGLPILEMEIGLKEGPDSSGRVTLEVVTSSRRLGHSFPAGLSPPAKVWLEVEAGARSAAALMQSGPSDVPRVLTPDGTIQDVFTFPLGLDPPDGLRVRARWFYKRDGKTDSPVQTLAQREEELVLKKASF